MLDYSVSFDDTIEVLLFEMSLYYFSNINPNTNKSSKWTEFDPLLVKFNMIAFEITSGIKRAILILINNVIADTNWIPNKQSIVTDNRAQDIASSHILPPIGKGNLIGDSSAPFMNSSPTDIFFITVINSSELEMFFFHTLNSFIVGEAKGQTLRQKQYK